MNNIATSFSFLAFWGGQSLSVPLPVTIACTCIFSYGLGRYGLKWWRSLQQESLENEQDSKSSEEVVEQLQKLVRSIEKNFKKHEERFASFEKNAANLLESGNQSQSTPLAEEAKEILESTLAVTDDVRRAFSRVHDQIEQLGVATDVHDDALTGIHDRKTLQSAMKRMCVMRDRYGFTFSLLAVSVDRTEDEEQQADDLNPQELLRNLAVVIGQTVRDTDLVARWEKGQFIVLLPYATVKAAEMFGDRLREKVAAELPVTVSIGVVNSSSEVDPDSLPQRCIEAQLAAQAEGENRLHVYENQSADGHLESSVPAGGALNEAEPVGAADGERIQ